MATKELVPFPAVQDETIVSQNVGGQAPSRTDAVGIEIPVVVHASRYSADLGKALPPLHEKTHTAIVFPNGGIVRLAANLSVGELVVLTNQQSGSDVLCRVSSVKTHPGSQNYVALEFTQRAPEFWAPCFVAQLPSLVEEPSPKPSLPIATTSFDIHPPVQPTVSRPPSKAAPASPLPARPPDVAFAATPFNGVPVQSPDKSQMEVVAPPSSTSDLDATPGLAGSGLAQSSDVGQQIAANDQGLTPSPTLKKGLWVLASAVVVVALTIGGFLMGRHGQFTSPSPQFAATSPTASVQPSAVTPALPRSIEPTAASASSTVLSATSSQKPAALEGVQNGNSPSLSSRRSDVEKLLRPLRNPTAKIDSSEPPQMLQTPRNSFTETALGTGSLAGSRADVPAPPTSAASTQLQAPQLIYSPPLVYPVHARQANIEGVVVVDAVVDGTGKVVDVNVVSGPLPLQQAAVEAVHAFKYQPARLDGRPVAEHMTVNLNFTLSQTAASAAAELKTQPPLTQSLSVIAPASSAASETPKVISSPPPIYPPVARSENIEGTVVLDILVDATGKVTQTKAISGPVQLQPAAVDAVRYWKYQPARNDGQPVAQHMQVSINFRLH